jgi:DNA invertase Pin-like site-specific DNA recombinase
MTIAMYVRVSTEEQNEDGQRRELKKWIVANGIDYKSVHWYVDKANGSTLDRPELDQLRRDVRNGTIKTVVVWKLDRLSRNAMQGYNLIGEWCDKKVRIVSVTEPIDLSGLIGQAIANLFLTFAQIEKQNIKQRQTAGIEAAKERGVYKGRKPGAIKAGVNLKKVFKLRDKGFTQEEIARAMGISLSSVGRYLKLEQDVALKD